MKEREIVKKKRYTTERKKNLREKECVKYTRDEQKKRERESE